jgi:hypothetical protein
MMVVLITRYLTLNHSRMHDYVDKYFTEMKTTQRCVLTVICGHHYRPHTLNVTEQAH